MFPREKEAVSDLTQVTRNKITDSSTLTVVDTDPQLDHGGRSSSWTEGRVLTGRVVSSHRNTENT